MKIIANPNTFDEVQYFPEKGDLDVYVPQVTSDPASPADEDVWVLRENDGEAIPNGTPIGMLLGLTYSTYIYKFSYKTKEGGTKRFQLT
jgi:hypothetical protein